MKEALFNDLVESIRQAGGIKKSKMKPQREFHFSPLDIKAIRRKLHLPFPSNPFVKVSLLFVI